MNDEKRTPAQHLEAYMHDLRRMIDAMPGETDREKLPRFLGCVSDLTGVRFGELVLEGEPITPTRTKH